MGEKILKLRDEGKSYNEIVKLLGCSKSLVSYYCGEGQKDKNRERLKKLKKSNALIKRVENFQSRRGRQTVKNVRTFNWKDVINKFSWDTTCYLTGCPINLRDTTSYNLDHIHPVSKEGSLTMDNLGICCVKANAAKKDMTVIELIDLCKKILEHNGYEINKE